jgi:hypothetical protein
VNLFGFGSVLGFGWSCTDFRVIDTKPLTSEEEQQRGLQKQQQDAQVDQQQNFMLEVTNYMAWQNYYAANNYPYYMNEFGMPHYYDPTLYPQGQEGQQEGGNETQVQPVVVDPSQNDAPL